VKGQGPPQAMNHRPTIFLSAAEISGDEHAARLLESLRKRIPDARFVGVAGEMMAATGCEVVADLTRRASMLGGPLLKLGYYIRTLRRLKRTIRRIRPDVHVPVDSPALNWHLAAAAKKCGASVVYYIAPQVWAWAPWRVRKLKRLTDRVACILPFEQKYLRERGVAAEYVGHPLFDTLDPRGGPLPDLSDAWLEGNWRVALLPGSRPAEINNHAEALLEVARAIRRRWANAECTFAARTEPLAETIRHACAAREENGIDVTVARTREVLAKAHFAVAVSGTITLEAAHFGVPMVIFYRVSRLAYGLLGKRLIRTPHLSLVNILAGRKIVPEMMPWFGSVGKLTRMVLEVMDDVGYLHEARDELLKLVAPLELPDRSKACDNAADLIVNILRRRR